ncbi:putative cyclase [Heliocybe sulcata]|uniref:Putative cyclase n=1 Tax=Heliocybe sulcata TaxID=5364 RepID=A0A5C3N1A0_9AGAM|nr:putative cyclase [Heliocybe sulcata]
MSALIDLSHPLHEGMQVYPNDPKFCCRPAATVAEHGYNVQSLSLGSHTGTHVDAPYHFFADGKTIDQFPLSTFVGIALVVDVSTYRAREQIEWEDLAAYSGALEPGMILLLYTGWSQYWGTDKYYDHPYLARHAAERIVATGVRVVGIDALSPDETRLDGSDGDWGVHETVLGAGGIIAENLRNIEKIVDREATVSLAPLHLRGGDGAPTRAFAMCR